MFSALNISRLAALLTTVAGALTVFGNAMSSSGKTGIGAAAAGVIAVWIHEEHATERNTTTAAAALTPPAVPAIPAPSPADVHALLGALGAPTVLGAPGAPD